MLTYIIKHLIEAMNKNYDKLELRFADKFEEEFDSLKDELKDCKYNKFRIECYPNDFLVRFDLRK